MQHGEFRHPDRIVSYFQAEIPLLIIITVSGLSYNIGMLARPYFEGRLAQCLYDIIGGTAALPDMVRIGIAYLLTFLFVQGMRAVKRFGVRRFANDISRSMRECLYNCLLHRSSPAGDSSGQLLTKAISDVDACAEGIRKFTTEIFDTGVVMIAYLAMLLHYDWRLTLLCCCFAPLVYLIADRLKKIVTKANSAYKTSASAVNSMTLDRVGNAITYRVYGREAARDAAYEETLTDYEKKSARANLFEGSLTPLYEAIAMAGTVLVLVIGSRNVLGTGWAQWNIAAFTTYLSCFTQLAVKSSHAAKLFNAVQKAEVSWKRIRPMMQEPVRDTMNPDLIPVRPAELVFDHVSCRFPAEQNAGAADNSGAGSWFLRDISFSAKPGEIIGITGEVASGKTLLGRVLTGEAEYQGKITIGGHDFASIPPKDRWLLISYLGHDPELLSTSFEDNIALGSGQTDADRFLKLTGMDEDLRQLDRTKDDPVGSAGTMLSGGQQARLALARTLAHAGSVLVLDDPFAAVDKTTETTILKAIRKEYPDRVILMISHRLYHFPEFDRILYLHDGTGTFLTHREMLGKEPGYRALYEKQTEGRDYDG